LRPVADMEEVDEADLRQFLEATTEGDLELIRQLVAQEPLLLRGREGRIGANAVSAVKRVEAWLRLTTQSSCWGQYSL
jgi:hypothetical protein